jgi:hypothetical protein
MDVINYQLKLIKDNVKSVNNNYVAIFKVVFFVNKLTIV